MVTEEAIIAETVKELIRIFGEDSLPDARRVAALNMRRPGMAEGWYRFWLSVWRELGTR